jgi:uncharacterized protein YprB with RNaseH-like and TPR domain
MNGFGSSSPHDASDRASLTERLRRAIAALRGKTAKPPGPIAVAARDTQGGAGGAGPLEGEELRQQGGQCWLVRRAVHVPLESWLRTIDGCHQWRSGYLPNDCLQELAVLRDSLPNVLFLDLETTALKDGVIIVVGLLRFDPAEGWLVEQYLARSYEEEPMILRLFWQQLRELPVLVTYNGKKFDWPYLVDRSVRHRIVSPTEAERPSRRFYHCDLLRPARYYWKERLDLPNCRLQTLEYCICGRSREGDIATDQIARAYEMFLQTGRTADLRRILRHNAFDLETLAELTVRLLADLLTP